MDSYLSSKLASFLSPRYSANSTKISGKTVQLFLLKLFSLLSVYNSTTEKYFILLFIFIAVLHLLMLILLYFSSNVVSSRSSISFFLSN